MSKVIEIVTFPCSEAFSNDQATVLGPALEASMRSPGCLQTYYGLQFEKEDGKQVGCFAAVWETYEAHKNLMALPNYSAAVQKAFGPAVAGKPQVRHVQHLTGDLDGAVSAPVTEIATFNLKEGSTLEAAKEKLIAFGDELRRTGCHGLVWGDCVEHPNTLIAMLGWESIEAHITAVKGERLVELRRDGMTLVDMDAKHYTYAKYPNT